MESVGGQEVSAVTTDSSQFKSKHVQETIMSMSLSVHTSAVRLTVQVLFVLYFFKECFNDY